MKIIGIVGSRTRSTSIVFSIIEKKFLELYEDGDWICSGGCGQGADKFAEQLAKQKGVPILIFYPNYKKYGVPATFIRNSEIAKHSNILIACVSHDRTGGTEDTIKKFLAEKEKEKLYLL
jgi:hypothetical protein